MRTDLWQRTSGFDARLHSERAVIAEWVQRIACDTEYSIACPFEMIAFRQNTDHKIEIRLTMKEIQQAERELQAAGIMPQDAHALLNELLPPLRPRRPSACYSPFPRPAQSMSALNAGTDASAVMLQYAREQLQALALSVAEEHAAFLTHLNDKNAEAHHTLGVALHAQGRRYEAVRALGQSLMLDQSNRQFTWDILTLWRDLNDLECGNFVATKIVDLHHDDAEMQEMINWFITRNREQKGEQFVTSLFPAGRSGIRCRRELRG